MDLKEKKEQRAKLVAQLQDMASLVKTEARAFSAEEKEKFDRMKNEVSSLRAEIETLESLHSLDDIASVQEEVSRSATKSTQRLPSEADKRMALRGWLLNKADGHVADEYRVAAARCGMELNAAQLEIRQQTKGTNSQGGFVVPSADMGQLVEVMKHFGGMRQAATYMNVADGRGLRVPRLDDTSNVAGRVAELAAVTTTALTFAESQIAVASYRSAVFPVSRELLQDASVPLESLIAKKLGERLARVINTHSTTHADFQGLTNGLSADAYTFTKAAITFADLVKMKNKVDIAYQANSKLMLNSTVLQEIELMVDDEGRPLWRPDLINGVPPRILGKEYIVNEDLTNNQIIYGDIAEAYTMVEVGTPTIDVLKERYIVENNAIGIVIFSRWGGKVVNPSAVKLYNRTA